MNVAVFGCGSIGRRHLRNLRTVGGANRYFAYDPDPAARDVAAAETNVEVFDSLDTVWKRQPDAVFVTSPTQFHVEHAWLAAQHGCHLFIEKPLSHTFDKLDDLIGEVGNQNLVTMVGCNMRFHPGPRKVKELLTSFCLGEIFAARIQTGSFLPRWRPQQDYRRSYSASPDHGGAILDCIHEIDLALWYFGSGRLVGALHRPAISLGLETDGLAELLIRHDALIISSIHLNYVQRDYRRCCQIIGQSGTIYWDFARKQVDVFGEDGVLRESFCEPSGWEINQMYVDEIRHFLDCVSHRRETTNPVRGGVEALRIALDARNSANSF